MEKKKERLINLIKLAQEQHSNEHLVLAVPSFLSKKFIAYCSMKEDLELIRQYIIEIRSNPEGVVKSALSFSLIALYGKCFTDASKSSFPKLEASDLFEKEDSHYTTHNYLMELRHKFIAHRGETENEIGIAYILVPKEGNLDMTQVRFSQVKMVGFSAEDLDKFEILATYLIEKLMDKIQKSGQKVYEGMLNIFSPEELTLMMMNGVK